MRYEDTLRAKPGEYQILFRSEPTIVRLSLEERDALADAVTALRDLLDYSERARGGDPSLTSESYYVERDFSRLTLAKLDSWAGSKDSVTNTEST